MLISGVCAFWLVTYFPPLPETGYYRISAEKPDPCYPTGAGKKADSGPYSHSMSNVEDNRLQAGESPPDTIILTNTTINENNMYGELIGRLQTIDADTLDSHSYTLVSGEGVSKFDGVNWTTYDISDGLANNGVTSIIMDLEENIWFGTDGGVSKFDGVNWTTYTTDDGLADNHVNLIVIDSEGIKWIAYGYNGKGVSKFDGTNWTTYTESDGLIDNRVLSIGIDSEGNKWFGTRAGLSFFGDSTAVTID